MKKAIKSAYRKKAQLHPDVNKTDASAEEHFKEPNEAYEVLAKDPKSGSRHDRFGADWNAIGRPNRPIPPKRPGIFLTGLGVAEPADEIHGASSNAIRAFPTSLRYVARRCLRQDDERATSTDGARSHSRNAVRITNIRWNQLA